MVLPKFDATGAPAPIASNTGRFRSDLSDERKIGQIRYDPGEENNEYEADYLQCDERKCPLVDVSEGHAGKFQGLHEEQGIYVKILVVRS